MLGSRRDSAAIYRLLDSLLSTKIIEKTRRRMSETFVQISSDADERIDVKNHRFPFCIVWTPLPIISWLFPFIGHMGICTSTGVIRDFAGSYYVSEGHMGFSWPTLYWQLSPKNVVGGVAAWDRAVNDASIEYESHCHNICCDNCHSHVAMALNLMKYKGKTSWNMANLAFFILIHGKFVGISGFLKQYLPFLIILLIIGLIVLLPVLSN
uniref:Transmembrane protein 222 n=1 Tax=Panagrolaimus sp. JU765 TaxID=591449 RepID=A0AC34RMX0_9BILA